MTSQCFLSRSAAALFLLALLPAMGSPQNAVAQSPDEAAPVEVLLLGTVHLDNPGRDVNNPDVPDVLAPTKQRELQTLRDALARFQPDKMAVEIRRRHQSRVDSLYTAFRAGRLDTSFAVGDFTSVRSEQYQLGFRLADRLGHPRVWAVDHMIPMRIGRVTSFAKKQAPTLLQDLQAFSQGPLPTTIDSLLRHETLGTLYRFLNRPSTVEAFRTPNTLMATAVTDSTFVGADVVADYHERNLRIFANIARIAEPGDRIIAIFGAGHTPYLRPLIQSSPRMRFVDPLDYL